MLNVDSRPQYSGFWPVSHTASHTQPVRYTKDDVDILRQEPIGSPSEPYTIKLYIHIKGTQHYALVRMVDTGACDWHYDLDGARATTPKGKELKGEEGKLPEPVAALFKKLWGDSALQGNAPKKNLG